ncbi:hypothetical protein GQ457_01G052910 [Hibiscus cannabinus]
MMTGMVQVQNLEKKTGKQTGCMGGFFQIFDRHQILTGKRLHSIKRLPSTASREATSEQEKSVESPVTPKDRSTPSQEKSRQSVEPYNTTGCRNKSPSRSPIFEFNEISSRSPWKFSKEAPRLSLDSRAVVDATGSLKPREIRTNATVLSPNQCKSNREEDGVDEIDKQRRSTSVVARLMGLEAPLRDSGPEQSRQSELRRSASEARGRDPFHFQPRFIEGVNFLLKQSQQSNLRNGEISSNVVTENGAKQERVMSNGSERSRNVRAEPVKAPVRGMVQRKRFYDSVDFFPETKQTVSIYGEIEKRLKLRGIDEPSKDIETVKQFLEALKLKGLLHTKPEKQRGDRNFTYEHEQSPIVVIKPAAIRKTGNEFSPSGYSPRPGTRRNPNLDSPPTMSPRRDRPERERNLRNQSRARGSISPTRSDNGVKRPSGKPLSIETQRGNGNVEQRRVPPVQSARVNVRRTGLDQTTNRSLGSRKSTADIPAEDETSTASECSISSSSQTDTERCKVDAYKEGRSLLERCDKLLHSIAEMTATTAESQPSPVSVLDSSLYKDESSPSLVMQRRIDFKDQVIESEDELWSPASAMSSAESKLSDKTDDCEFIYISDILRASSCLPDDADIFLLLEKQQYLKGKDTSKVYRLQRKLIFDTIREILNRKGQLPPWKLNPWTGHTSLQQIWSEFQKIQERDSSDDLFEVICGVLRKDLAGDAINGWEDCPIEMSQAVLDIERLIFKDLIVETIGELTDFSGKSTKFPAICRKLVF